MTEPLYSSVQKSEEQIVTELQIPDHAIRRFARFLLSKLQDDPETIPSSDESPGE